MILTFRSPLGRVPGASIDLRRLLDASHGPVQTPIRSEIFGPARFAEHGRSLGETHRAGPADSFTATFFPRLRSNIRMLRAAHHYICSQTASGHDISPAAEWLLDNFHLVEAQLKEIHDGLPRNYFRTLPMLQDAPLAGLPRVYGVAWAFVAHTDGAFDEDLLVHFLDAYERTRELNLGEMWALPTTLRVVLIEDLRRLAERVAVNKAARELANLCCDHIAACPAALLTEVLAALNRRGAGRMFLAQMSLRWLDLGATAALQHASEQEAWLRAELPDPSSIQAQQSADQAADNQSVSNALMSLRAIGDADWSDIIARTSPLMRLMLGSPVFKAEHALTRDQSLHSIEQMARRSGRTETAVAQALLALMHAPVPEQDTALDLTPPDARVPMHWLEGAGRATLLQALSVPASSTLRAALVWRPILRRLAVPLYLGAMGLVTLLLMSSLMKHTGLGTWSVDNPGPVTPLAVALLGLLMLAFPASEAVVAVVNRLISEFARPEPMPRLAFTEGIPTGHRVMVVIPAMLTQASATHALVHRLLLHHLANPEQQAQFALLTDWADADAAQAAGDDGLLIDAIRQIEALNSHHAPLTNTTGGQGAAPRFILLHRRRRFSVSEQRWIGWERKRGKLEQLISALAHDTKLGESAGAAQDFIDLGAWSTLADGVRYVVTLDSDTQLPPGRLRELVSVAAHPYNQPRLSADGRRVVHGWGILQPRVMTPLPSPSTLTHFHTLFAGQCGVDPYSATTSEVYQDLFSEGTFTGKGLLHVHALATVLGGRLPENQILSHDMIEGALARCASVSDIAVIENAPFHADAAAARLHRWTRGDWQLLPILMHARRYGLGAIHRWKLLDNLRRSLVAPMSLGLILLALAGHVLSPFVALFVVMAALSAGPLMGAFTGLIPHRNDLAWRHFAHQASADLAHASVAGVWLFAQLLQQTLRTVDAIARALYRSTISHRHLLQWTTSDATEASLRPGFAAAWRRHWSETLVAAGLFGALWALDTPTPWTAALLCAVWAASPVWTWWASRPPIAPEATALTADEHVALSDIARDTWRYFERCVGPDDRYLPPDNLQTSPHDMVAHRTSPTNIGLYLLSVACARQFGWIGTLDLLDRLDATLNSLDTLERHNGHFLNWYDTSSGDALLPMYVSTVDSGNLGGHLLAVAQACRMLARDPLNADASERALKTSQTRLAPLLAGRYGGSVASREQLRWCLADHRATQHAMRRDQAARLATPATAEADTCRARLEDVARRCEHMALAADYSFLYDARRHLFHIGYRVAEQSLDTSYYDLLASESRLTSLLAIAKGDVPASHWAALGRPFFAVGALAGLRSWSGSMFEYLMPTLVNDEPAGSVLADAGLTALHEHIEFTRPRGVPWGVSESAYAERDHTLAYQYAPQGAARLALRRTPPDELVIAPYATALAAQIAPQLACLNFTALAALGARGRYGFVDAIDFTRSRQANDTPCTLVHTYMAHHQGMSIVALSNVLMAGVAQQWGMSHPAIEAVDSLLHERSPREVSSLARVGPRMRAPASPYRAPGMMREVLPGEAAIAPTQLLSNGRYSVSLRANGAGWSRWMGTDINRWRDDALRDAHGSFLYLRWDRQPQVVSVTQHPAPDPRARYSSTFHTDRVVMDAAWSELQAQTTVWVSPEDDIEFRQVTLRNLSDRTLDIELISAFEVSLTDARADEAHPAFVKLFVKGAWRAAQEALIWSRTPRLDTEPPVHAAHFLAGAVADVVSIHIQPDRQHWLGRNRAISLPLAVVQAPPGSAAEGDAPLTTGLDPMSALAIRVRIAPHAKALLTLATSASDQPEVLRAVIDKYRQPSHVQRALVMSATLAAIRLREMRLGADDYTAIQGLTTALVLSLSRPDLAPADDARTSTPTTSPPTARTCDRRQLWRLGLSGDRPIVLVSASANQGLRLVQTLAQALRLWSWSGLACDLVVVNAEADSYHMSLHRDIAALSQKHAADSAAQPHRDSTSFHLIRRKDLSTDELDTLLGLARVRLQADGRPLLHHVRAWLQRHEQDQTRRSETSTTTLVARTGPASPVPVPQGQFETNGKAGFTFDVSDTQRPSRPWINVLANPTFGAQLTEAGGGCTWAGNSRMNQLTTWSNDPVADPPPEWFLIQDLHDLSVWSTTACAWGDEGLTYHVTHGQGYSRVSHRRHDVSVTVTWCVDAEAAVKQVHVRVVNHGSQVQHLRLVGIAEWMMGAHRSDRDTVRTALLRQRLPDQPQAGKLMALMCTQKDRSAGFGDGTAYLALASDDLPDDPDDWTCDRRECFDARGRLVLPDHFGRNAGDGLDPCAALSTRLHLTSGATAERTFLIGYAANPDAARSSALRAAMQAPAQRLNDVLQRWDTLLSAATVQTPDPLFDALVNRWLLYQTVSCRLWAKAGFYQAGGATGFRDQLQDTMALSWAEPALLAQQIRQCAARQFAKGDVQHWWHAPQGAGVRTRFSDDLLWLPYACVRHVKTTGDVSLLDESVPFLEGVEIPDGAEDAYDTPTVSALQASVYEHAARAIDRSLQVGSHGLPLMGSGDWNDGMNRVGIEGRGESVWLGWFLCQIVADFAPQARARGDMLRADRWTQAAEGWQEALQGPAWDGRWYKRAFFDDGQALGSHENPEARIDLIAQAWSVLSGVAPADRQVQALAAVEAELVDPAGSLIRLLDPPLARAQPNAGYIQAYPPGVRENGGQYNHAAVWALMARAQAQQHPATWLAEGNAQVWRDFTWLSPAHRTQDPATRSAYHLEPYVMAGDVYSQAPYVGRGGWSWYTGAAAWLHRAAIESMFGLQLDADSVSFRPCLPAHWPSATLTLRRGGKTLHLTFQQDPPDAAGTTAAPAAASNATPLSVGEVVPWHALPAESWRTIALSGSGHA